MKEILFRGKRKDNGEWIEGFYFQKKNPFSEYGEPIRHFISDLPPFGAEVIHETVGQYTGLKDKNGKRIFEGDVVRAKRIDNYEIYTGYVVWGKGCFDIKIKKMNKPAIDLFKDFEVIGNIHDNPELLEVKV